MRDDDIRVLFDEVDDGPAMSVSADDVIARGARIRDRRRTLAIIGSALASAAAVIGVAVAVSPADREPIRPAGPVRTVTPAPAPPIAVPPPGVPTADPVPGAEPRSPGASSRQAESTP
ncbi:hypothetical protein [Amycolatopsis thermophila]|uniref:Uncharacterized protein n=1 Tax=Amycolatopsis thermophila TaxID=206084 RepID=A0ABU0EPT1_9PSEU|nr:hypothetical protein [Amycolatopsis thermophila]MDQ0377310.1 hypothetical protein [Amycolatopsis thermophila]